MTVNPPKQPLSRLVQAGGLRWHVQQAGEGPVMLLIHGTGASTHSWRRLVPLLETAYRVIAVDLPGHGLTSSAGPVPRLPSSASIPGMSAALAALLRELEVDVRYCVGHSAGAVLLCRMALDRHIAPEVIISVNGAFVPLAGAAGTWFSPIARLLGRNSLVPRLVAWGAGDPDKIRRMIAATGSTLDAEGIDLYTRLVRKPRHVAGALEMMGNWDLYRFERDLRKLSIPLALIVADGDRTVPPEQAQWVLERVAHAEIYRLPRLGHLAHEEDPALAVRTIETICRAVSGSLSSPGAV